MGWDVKKIIRCQTKHGLWGSNLKTRKFLPQGLSGSNLLHLFQNQASPVAGLPCCPLVVDLNHFHEHSNTSYVDLFGRGVWVRGLGNAEGELLKNLTSPILVQSGQVRAYLKGTGPQKKNLKSV